MLPILLETMAHDGRKVVICTLVGICYENNMCLMDDGSGDFFWMSVKEAVAAGAVLQGAPIVMLAETTNAINKTELPQATLSNSSCLDAPLAKKTNTRDKTGLLEETLSNAIYEDTPATSKEWDKHSTLILIQLCKDEEGTSNYSRKFWEIVSTTLDNSRYKFSWEQCKIKFQNLKAQYKQKKEKKQRSGEGRITWQFYDEMDNLMAKKPEISPVAIASNEDGFKIGEEDCEHSSESDYTSEPEASQKRKTKKKKTVAEILHKLTEQAERRHKERYEQRERALKLLQEIKDKNVQ